jgi:hypothetical protein
MQQTHTITSQPAMTRPLTLGDRLESARTRVRFALACADDGDVSVDTLDAISRALVAATSDLETLAIELDTHRERMAR